jgi:hypothetical protein
MPEQPEPKKEPNAWTMFAVILMRLIDSGLGPWVAVSMFVLGGLYILTRNLDSHDNLALLSSIKISGFSWLGWVIALLEIPVFRWAVSREKRMGKNRVARLEDENKEAKEMLKKYRQSDLKLEGESRT